MTQPSRPRSFVSESGVPSGSQIIHYTAKEVCQNCSEILGLREITNGWTRVEFDYHSECSKCRESYLPRLHVHIGDFNEVESLFISAQTLQALVSELLFKENKFYLDLELMKKSHSLIFWNLLWHFQRKRFPHEFMIPYAG